MKATSPVLASLLVTCMALMIGCGARRPESSAAPSDRAYLIVRADGEHLRTEWRDVEGRLRGRADGVLLGVGDRLYRFESRSQLVELGACAAHEDPDSGADVASNGTIAGAQLDGIGGIASLELIVPTSGSLDALRAYREVHTVIGALGDRIVIQSVRERDICGGRAEREVTVRTFDLGSGRELFPTDTEREAMRPREDEALRAMRELDPAGTDACLRGATSSYQLSTPAFGLEGVSSLHRFVASPVPFACGTLPAPSSSGEWSTWLVGGESELPMLYGERAIPEHVRTEANGALGITWLAADRAPLSDAFALVSE
jgi:hypothetical protein